MEANVWEVGEVFNRGGDVHYVLPRFQRAYAWEEEQWQTLWDDLLAMRAEERAGAEHFLGAMVVIREDSPASHIPTYCLVDGQQRLLTLSLVLCALAEQVDDNKVLRAQIRSYLENRFGEDHLRFKVLPTLHYRDRDAWAALVKDNVLQDATRSRIPEAMDFFRRVIRQAVERQDVTLQELFNTLTTRLFLVFINLNREERPHQIFESLNTKGLDLSEPDKVRNYLAMRLEATRQDDVYDRYWLPIQDLLDDQRAGELSAFLRHYLARVTRRLVNERDVYKEFRQRMDHEFQGEGAMVGELDRLLRHAQFYDRLLRPQNEPDEALRTRLEYINALQRTVAYPLLLSFYDANDRCVLPHADFCAALDILENYLVRHYLVGMSTAPLQRMLLALISKDELVVDIQALKHDLHRRQYPGDDRIREILSWRGVYRGGAERRRLVYTLMRVNQRLLQGSDVRIDLADDPSIEHIMPRTLSRAWQSDLGPQWEQDHRELLDTLGNLTLVTRSWNTSASNRPWREKRAQLQRHGLPLNNHWFGSGQPGAVTLLWNRNAIEARNEWLVDRILEVWPDLRDRQPRDWDAERDPNPYVDYTGKSVVSFTLHGETFNVPFNAWNNCAARFTDLVAVPRLDFEEIADQVSESINRDHGYRQLANGWWLHYMPSSVAATYLIDLAALCDLDDADWHITLRE